ncbi:MAG TPA: response regulator [Bryobacteraceae bacterium]|nr:response regulator [Bryobacteraceae bacterium]
MQISLIAIGRCVVSKLPATALLLLATIHPCFALDPAKNLSQYVHTVWSDGNGLPKNAEIRKILQTSDGYLWLATDAGLVRFNGSEFTVFSAATTPAFKYNDVQVLFEDRQHTLWIATSNGAYHGDLIRYREGNFQRIAENEGPGSFSVVSIVSTTAGDIWFGTANHGIFRYRDGRFTAYSLPGGYSLLLTLYLDSRGDLWACAGAGLLHFERNGFVRFDRVPELSAERVQVFDLAESPDGEWSVATTIKGLVTVPALASLRAAPKLPGQRRFVSQARFDRQGGLWFAEQIGGLYRWKDQHLDQFKPGSGGDTLDVEALYEDRLGSLWVGTTNHGVCRVPNSNANEPLDCFTEKNGLRGGAVMSMLEDREGSIWIGTAGGTLERFKDNALTLYGKGEGLASQVRSLYVAHDRSIWLGTDSGLVRFDNAKPVTFLAPFGPANNRVRSIAEDREGNIWTGTAYGLNQFAKKGIKTFPATDVVALHPDRDGGVWFAQSTVTMGISRLLDGKTQVYFDRPRSEQAIVSAILEDHAGTLWLGTAGGVSRLDGRNKTDFRIQEGDTDSSGVTYYTPGVTQMFEDADQVLWIGTHHSGLWRLKEKHLTAFNTADGLYDNSVLGVVEDNYGFLWMAGWRGISKVKKSELNDLAAHKISRVSPILYGVSDRAEGAGCTAGGQSPALKTSSGSLLFTCMKGVVSVDPSHLPFNRTPPPVNIEQVLLNGLHAVARNARTPVGKGDVEFHYAALSYLAPEKVQYKYRLVGYDKDWISPGNRHVAYYTNLPPGDYTFQVVACNNDGIWNNEGAAFNFYLQPHFYQTAWFSLLCILGVLGLMVEIYRFRLRRVRKHERELVSLVDMRTHELKKEIARRRQAQEAAQQAREAAESATRAKSEFLANMSHEIRTPLNGVIGTLELASETDPTPEQAELLNMAHESANSLRVVIDDILDFSKIEAGKLAFECAAFDLADTVADAARSVAIRAHQKKLELAWAVSSEAPPMLLGDATRLKQVLINLLGNAIKFTQQGEIVLRVEAGRRNDDKIALRFSVSDTGIGIPKDKQKLIFEAFAQEDASTTRKFGGTGLGLTICSRIVKLMGGEIWVDSEPGHGATFYFTSAFQVAVGENSPLNEVKVELQGVSALIVDDNLTNRRILEGMLKSWGMLPVVADSGMAGLQLMRQAADSGCPFRLVLADCQMPEMDGFQFIERVKETPSLAAPAIMMLSSDDFNGTPQRCRSLGLAGSLIKPLKQSELMAAIRAALDRNGAAHPVAEMSPAAARRLTILLAEDNQVNQRLAVRLLEKAGHRVLVANNGREVLEILNRESVDLVLMDVQMPEMDGLTATGLIREKEQRTGSHVPIIAMTAHAMTGDRERMIAAGMDDYVSKPIDIKRLRETINRIAGKVSIHA